MPMAPMHSRRCSRRAALSAIGQLLASSGALAFLAACGESAATTSGATGAATSSAAVSSQAATSNAVGSATTSAASATSAAAATASTSAASSSAAASAAPKPTPTPATGETRQGAALTLNLWYGWAGANAIQTWQALGKEMGKQLTGFNVHWLTADNNTKLLTAIAGGVPPDVAVGNAPYPEFWARGAAEPLDANVAKSKVVTKQDIPEPYWSYASFKGKVYGIPALEAFARFGLALDMTNLEQYNVDPKTFSWDWDTITQLQQETTKVAANNSIAVIGIDPLDAMGGAFGGSDPLYWGQAWGIEYYDAGNRTFNFANDQLVEGLTILKKIYDLAGGAAKVSGFHSSYGYWTGNPTAAFPSGVENLEINGYWNPGDLALTAPKRAFAYTWAPVPAAKKGFKFQTLVGHSAFVPKGAKYIADAFQLIEFLVDDTAEQIVFDSTGWLGARQSFLKKVDVNRYKGLDFYVNSVKQADKLYGMPSNPIESYCSQQWNTVQQDVLYGKAQPKAALQQLQQLVTNELKQRFPNG